MKVYTAERHVDYEGFDLLGIFSTKDKAERAIEKDKEAEFASYTDGYEINEFTPTEEIGFISATKIRESIKNGDNTWKDLVDVSIQKDVEKYLYESGVES